MNVSETESRWMFRPQNVLVCQHECQFYSFTFLEISLVGTENKATLSRNADMRLQLRSLAWHGVMVRWTQRWGQSDVKMDEWKRVGGQRTVYSTLNSNECKAGLKSNKPQAELVSLRCMAC